MMMIAMMPTSATIMSNGGSSGGGGSITTNGLNEVRSDRTSNVPAADTNTTVQRNAKSKVPVYPCNSSGKLLANESTGPTRLVKQPPPSHHRHFNNHNNQTPQPVSVTTIHPPRLSTSSLSSTAEVYVEVQPNIEQLVRNRPTSNSSSPQHPSGDSFGKTTEQIKCKLIKIIMNLRLYLLLALLALVALAAVLVRSAPYGHICMTKDCVQEAAKILGSIDASVSPCEDFYRFSCGRWLDATIMPDHMPAQNVFSQVQDRQDRRLRELIEKPIDADNDADFVVKMKNFYRNCMNLTALNNRGEEPLRSVIEQLGGWPVLEGPLAPEPNVTLLSMYERLIRVGLADDMLVLITVIPHATNFSRNMLAISAPSFDLLDREFMTTTLDDMHLQTYYSLMLNTVGLLMQTRTNNDTLGSSYADWQQQQNGFSFKIEEAEKTLDSFAVREMKLVLEFEQSLANHSIKDTDKTNISSIYNNMTVGQLQILAPNIPWIDLINTLPVEKNVTDKDEILVVDVNYIRFLSESITTVPRRVLMNYVVWRVVQTKIGILNQVWRDLIENFNLINLGQTKPTPRWMHCVSHVQGQMGTALSNIYVKNYFTAEGKDKIDKIVHKILAEFRYTLERTEWMDNETRQKAIHKLDTMNFRIGFPNELLNDTLVSELYSKLTISEDDYFSNLIEIKKYMNYIKFANITIPNDREDWRSFSEVVEVNAYYFQQMNTFILNAGILQDIFFNPNRPDYLNYGAIGEVIGHEITHGFDSTGKQFDVHGHLHDWWNPETGKMFDQRASCMEKQYGKYHFDEINMKVNGLKTQDENIADNGGVGLAYRAYRRAHGFGNSETVLPALNYTAQQLFWISYGIGECEKMTNEVLKLRLVTDSHAPNKYRLIGVVSNSFDFATDFGCPADSPMHPKVKCKVW